jgi:hypothetical protein
MSRRILWLTHMLLAYNGYHHWQTWMGHLWNILLFILINTQFMQLTLHKIQGLFAQSIEIFWTSYCMMPNLLALVYFVHLFTLLLYILDMLPWIYDSRHVTFHFPWSTQLLKGWLFFPHPQIPFKSNSFEILIWAHVTSILRSLFDHNKNPLMIDKRILVGLC